MRPLHTFPSPWGHFSMSAWANCFLYDECLRTLSTSSQLLFGVMQGMKGECKTCWRVWMAPGCHVSTDPRNVFWHKYKMKERQNPECYMKLEMRNVCRSYFLIFRSKTWQHIDDEIDYKVTYICLLGTSF